MRKSIKAPYFNRSDRGAVLIYVLWILVVISTLAFQLTSAAGVNTLNYSAVANQLKKQMQLDSAIQFAMFKIHSNSWKNNKYQFDLNNQEINIEIYNESGFNSLYDMSNKSLNNVLKSINLNQEFIDKLDKLTSNSEKFVKFNSFSELPNIIDIDETTLKQLIPLVSIFHEEAVNPLHSPEQVLILLQGVDQFRVGKLMEATDENERMQLRKEIAELLVTHGLNASDDISLYYRVYITLADKKYIVFLKHDRRQKSYKVILGNNI